jgi:cytochrome c556
MIRLAIAAGTALAAATAASAQTEDPIATRQIIMIANGQAAGVAGNILRGDIDYNPVIGRAAITAMHSAATTFGDYFPEDSLDTDRSDAAPAIWENMDDFMALLEEFRSAAAAAAEAAGEDGPPDAESFAALVQPVLGTCRDCHEAFRLER